MPDEATEERLAQIERAHRRYAVARYAAEWAKDYGRDGGWGEAMAVALSELLEWTEPSDYEVTDDVINSERFRELWPAGARPAAPPQACPIMI